MDMASSSTALKDTSRPGDSDSDIRGCCCSVSCSTAATFVDNTRAEEAFLACFFDDGFLRLATLRLSSCGDGGDCGCCLGDDAAEEDDEEEEEEPPPMPLCTNDRSACSCIYINTRLMTDSMMEGWIG